MVIMSKFLSNSGLIFPKISKIKQENPSLSAAKGVNQVVTRFTPFFTPKNRGWVYFFFEFLR